MFWHVSVHPSVCPQGGTPPDQGVPRPGSVGVGGYLTWPVGGGPRSGPDGRGLPWPGLIGGTLARSDRGIPQPGPAGGYPSWPGGGVTQPGLDGGGYPARSDGGYLGQVWHGGYSSQVQTGGTLGYPGRGMHPRRHIPSRGTPSRGYPPVHDNRWSTWYAAVGISIAFTQEDFLVQWYHYFWKKYSWRTGTYSPFLHASQSYLANGVALIDPLYPSRETSLLY